MYGLTAGATKFHAFFHTLDISYVIFKAAKKFQWLLLYHVECDLYGCCEFLRILSSDFKRLAHFDEF